jgi:hypothetical protein
MEPLHPGVYIQEVPSGVRPMDGVSTSTAAFIGKAQIGPFDQAVLIRGLRRSSRTPSARFLPDSFLAHSLFQFFTSASCRQISSFRRFDPLRGQSGSRMRIDPTSAPHAVAERAKGRLS